MTSLVITVRSLVRRMRSIRANSRRRSRKLPPVMRAIAAMAWLWVKPAPSRVRPSWQSSPVSQLPQRALAAQAGWPRAATSVGPQPSQIYFGNEIQDSEPNILTPN